MSLADREGGGAPGRAIARGIGGLDFQAVGALGEVADGDFLHDGNDLFARLEKIGRRAQTAVDGDLAGFDIRDSQLELDSGVARC